MTAQFNVGDIVAHKHTRYIGRVHRTEWPFPGCVQVWWNLGFYDWCRPEPVLEVLKPASEEEA